MKYTLLGISLSIAFGFLIGYWAGEERAVLELKPCPITKLGKLTTKTTWPDGRVICQYATGHARSKKEIRL